MPQDLTVYDTDRGEPLQGVWEDEVDPDYNDRGTLCELDKGTGYVRMDFS